MDRGVSLSAIQVHSSQSSNSGGESPSILSLSVLRPMEIYQRVFQRQRRPLEKILKDLPLETTPRHGYIKIMMLTSRGCKFNLWCFVLGHSLICRGKVPPTPLNAWSHRAYRRQGSIDEDNNPSNYTTTANSGSSAATSAITSAANTPATTATSAGTPASAARKACSECRRKHVKCDLPTVGAPCTGCRRARGGPTVCTV
jgi:hypothetical protein